MDIVGMNFCNEYVTISIANCKNVVYNTRHVVATNMISTMIAHRKKFIEYMLAKHQKEQAVSLISI